MPFIKVSESTDGTKKYLFQTQSGYFIEAAMIPDEDRATLCISCQCGCKMGCRFCMTAKQGFSGQLTAAEILSQIVSIPEYKQLTNFVFMGMGEPMDNLGNVLAAIDAMTCEWGYGYSPSRITVSTIGLLEPLKLFLEKTECHLALSLHSPFEEERTSLIPMQKAEPFRQVLEYLESLDMPKRRRISIEYICFESLNDTPKHAAELAIILSHLGCRINLIPFHPVPEMPFQGTSRKGMETFQEILTDKGFICTIRRSRGLDIQAACGLLSTREFQKPE
jgi:23S rRNA (adenine2503-C2)-methyltransferase